MSKLSGLMGERKVRVARLARETGMARSTIDGLYYGRVKRVDMDTLDRLCRYFKVPLSAILEWEDDADASGQ